MADITASVVAWSGTEASNQPTGDTTIGAGLDDNLRAIQAGTAREALKGSDIASSGSITPGASGSYGFVDVTGTTTITSLGTAPAGLKRTLRFTGALTLTYNGTSLILPGSTDIVTEAGDVGEFISLGSGNWILSKWTPRNVLFTNNLWSMTSSTSGRPTVDYTNSTSDAASSKVRFFKSRSSATTNSGDVLGLVQAFGKDTSNADRAAGYFQFQQTGTAGATFVAGQYVLNLTNSSGSDTSVISATAAAVNVPVPLQENATRVFSRNSANVGSPPAAQAYDAANKTFTFAHGLGQVPLWVSVWAQCTSAELGYSIGDVVYISSGIGTATDYLSVSANSTNVLVSVANAIAVVNRTTPSSISALSTGKWDIYVRAWY